MSSAPHGSPTPQSAELPSAAISRMRLDDIETVAAIERTVYPFPWTAGNFADSIAAGYDAWLFGPRGAPIGYAIVMWLPDDVHLLNLSVAASRQRQGWGARMLSWLCSDCARRGAGSMLLEVRPSNVPARRLYDRFGFRQVGVRKRYYPAEEGSREDALVLRKTLGHG